MVAHGAGESAFDMAEEVAFEQLFGEAWTTDGDERFVGQMTLLVDGARAITLLPVPLSPMMRIEAGVLAARSKVSISSLMSGVVESSRGSGLWALLSLTSLSSRSMLLLNSWKRRTRASTR